MSEEDFKSIRITLSLEAFDRLEKIMKDAKFRSISSTIEESIRVLDYIIGDVTALIGKGGDPERKVPNELAALGFKTVGIRLERFTGRRYFPRLKKEKEGP